MRRIWTAGVIVAMLVLMAALVATTAANATHSVDGKGRIAFASDRSGNYDIWTMNADGGGLTRLTSDPADDLRPAWSPNHHKIVFSSNRSGNTDVWTMNADGSGQTQLTTDPASDGRPAWSPNGKKILFRSNRAGGVYEIFEMNADGSNQTQLTFLPGLSEQAHYSPNGKLILFTHSADDGTNGPIALWTMQARDGTHLTQITPDSLQAGSGVWSPNGHEITFQNNSCLTCANSDVYTIDANGKHLQQLTSFGNNLDPRWSPTGRSIVFSHEDPPITFDHEQIYTMNADGSDPVNLTNDTFDNVFPRWG
jgi:Tol biopolymer transport system component